MKSLRKLLIPAACFVVAWAVARHFAAKVVRADAPPEVVHMAPTKTNRERTDARTASAQSLANHFRARPMHEWAGLWEEFARDATADDLQALPLLFPKCRNGGRIQGDDLLQVLAHEELAVRAGRAVHLSPESFSALAEHNPEAAWDSLSRNNRSDFSTAALRTLSVKNPLETLGRFKSLPEGGDGPVDEGRRAAVWHTPVGAIFGAWARRDPQAAVAALASLPAADRSHAADHVGMTWAFRDGPAAIRHALDLDKSGDGFTSRHLRLDVMLRASFRTHPAETAKLMAENPTLRKVIGLPPSVYVALKPWHDADPEGMMAWLFDPENKSAGDAIIWLRPARDPDFAAAIIRHLATKEPERASGLTLTLYRRDPELALSLADELGIQLTGTKRFEEIRCHDEPADACDRWLAALREHGDPAEALASLGWSGDMACNLAARAAKVFPEKAAELAKLVPASSLDATNLWRRNNDDIVRFWPELAGALKYPSPRDTKPLFPEYRFQADPAAAAESLLLASPDTEDVTRVIELWAPHDLKSAREWLSRLPDGPARQQGERELAEIQLPYDPVASMEMLRTLPNSDPFVGQLWEPALRRLMYRGGDWKTWLARAPGERQDYMGRNLASEAAMLDFLRRSSGR